MVDKTYDQEIIAIRQKYGLTSLGLHSNKQWHEDPKHLLFSMARYKFVAKMLQGKKNVLEVGCGDGFVTRLVRQEVEKLVAIDIDPIFIKDIQSRTSNTWPIEAIQHNMLSGPVCGYFDAAYTLDVLEHIDPKEEDQFVKNIMNSILNDATLIIGMPSIESQLHSKPVSITGHINCKTGPDLKTFMQKYFSNVFLFSMNDEIVHTGHTKMAHYLFTLCCNKKY